MPIFPASVRWKIPTAFYALPGNEEKSTPYQNRNLYLHANNKVWYDKLLYPGRTTNCMISMQASSEDSQYASVISILTPMYIDELSAWKDTTPEHRGEDYQSFKRRKQNRFSASSEDMALTFQKT